MTYSSSVSLSRRTYARRPAPNSRARRHQNTVAFVTSAKTLGPVSNTIILILLACLIGLLYLTQVTKTNSFGYTINGLQQQQANLKKDQADLKVTAARLQSMDRVAASKVARNMVSTTPSGIIQ